MTHPAVYRSTEPDPIDGLHTIYFRYTRGVSVLEASVTACHGHPVFAKPWYRQDPEISFRAEYLDELGQRRWRYARAGGYRRGNKSVLTNPTLCAEDNLAEFPELISWLESLGYVTDRIR